MVPRQERNGFAREASDGVVATHERGASPKRGIGVLSVLEDATERGKAERRPRPSGSRFRTLVERVPVVTYTQEAAKPSRTTYLSPQYERILGYPSEEAMNDPDHWARTIHPDDREGVLAEDRRTNETGEPFVMEYRQFARDGRVVWIRDEATLVRDGAGEPLYWLGIQADITERRSAEEGLKESEERFRTLTEAALEALVISEGGTILEVNRAYTEMFGYEPAEVTGKSALVGIASESRGLVLGNISSSHPEPYEAVGLRKDGSRFDAEIRGKEFTYRGRGVRITALRDITERKRAEEALRRSNQQIVDILESVTDAFYALDREWRFTYLNKEAERILRVCKDDLLGKNIWEEFPETASLAFYPEYHKAMEEGETAIFEEYYRPLKGCFEMRAYPSGGGISVYFHDITERKALEERLEHQALHDSLTGLPNRRLFLDRLGQALRGTRRTKGRKVAVLFMDVDGFKNVNDSLGHEAGDRLLELVAGRLKESLRPEDTLARFGGDEFAVLIEDVGGPDGAARVAGRITEELRAPFPIEGQELFVGLSIGIALNGARSEGPEDLLRDADTAMYRAKDSGAGYSVFDTAMHEQAVARLDLENDLRRAIEREEFVVHYQPIVRLDRGEVVAVEALVRWEHPERGLLEPDEFVPLAEESGLVIPMGEQVLREACLTAKRWQEEHPCIPPLVVSVNLSARQLSRPDLAEVVERALGESGLEARSLSLDVTETIYVRALEGNADALSRLKELGVGISIDDFGTGYSSLSYLKRLPADALKIDKSFVAGVGEDAEDTAVVGMVIDLAHTFGMEAIAEGVETEEQARLLGEMGCDKAQGYHFARPLPPEEVPGFLAEQPPSG